MLLPFTCQDISSQDQPRIIFIIISCLVFTLSSYVHTSFAGDLSSQLYAEIAHCKQESNSRPFHDWPACVATADKLKPLSEGGDKVAQYELGMIFKNILLSTEDRDWLEQFDANRGKASNKVYDLGIEWIQRSASQDYAPALYELAKEINAKEKLEKKYSPEEGVSFLRKSATQMYPPALYELGYILAYGYLDNDSYYADVKKEPETGLKLIEQAATLGNSDAQYRLGYSLLTNSDDKVRSADKRDDKLAVEWLEKSALHDTSGNSAFLLMTLYYGTDEIQKMSFKDSLIKFNNSTVKNKEKAKILLEAMISSKEKNGCDNSWGSAPDYAAYLLSTYPEYANSPKAVSLWQREGGACVTEGASLLGHAYLHGLFGLPQDPFNAYILFNYTFTTPPASGKMDPTVWNLIKEDIAAAGARVSTQQKNCIKKEASLIRSPNRYLEQFETCKSSK